MGSIPGARCCCGSIDCAYLAHNGRLLEGLERDVSKAAQLGQVRLLQSLPCHPATMHLHMPLALLSSPPYDEGDATYLCATGSPHPP